uniref:Uncharacterized protein n=1 Tax=Oryza nivara TaxID=4536 RepID=A0A0E0HT82_ORYNI
MTKIPLILSHLSSLSSSSPLGSAAQLGIGMTAARLGMGTAAAHPGTGKAAAQLGTGKAAVRTGTAATRLGTGRRRRGWGRGRWRRQHDWGRWGCSPTLMQMAPPSQQRRRAEQPSPTHAGAIPVPSRANAAHLIADPISILLDDLLLKCLAGVPYATLPQLPTTSPRSLPPSRPRRAPPLIPHPLRQAL